MHLAKTIIQRDKLLRLGLDHKLAMISCCSCVINYSASRVNKESPPILHLLQQECVKRYGSEIENHSQVGGSNEPAEDETGR